jgi:hypothetical protein
MKLKTDCRATRQDKRPPMALELLEDRRLLSVTILQDPIFYDGGGLYAEAMFGDNGESEGMPTSAVGSSDVYDATTYTWVDRFWEGFDTGWQLFSLHVNVAANDYMSWTPGDHNTVYYEGGAGLASIERIYMISEVFGYGLETGWRNIEIDLYKDGDKIQTINIDLILASTMDYGAYFQQSGVLITPDFQGCDEIRISGEFRMQGDYGVYPGPTDLFGQIMIYDTLA